MGIIFSRYGFGTAGQIFSGLNRNTVITYANVAIADMYIAATFGIDTIRIRAFLCGF